MSEQQLDCALDLIRRLPPHKAEETLSNLIDLVPEISEDLLSAVDQPLKVAIDINNQRPYLLCEYNRDGDSFRSPWSNQYDPPTSDAIYPSEKIREIEIQANNAFDTYRELYFEGGISSVYLWDKEDSRGFAGVVLIKKEADQGRGIRGCWDSVHVLDISDSQDEKGRIVGTSYKLTSTIMLWIETNSQATGVVNLGGNMTRLNELTTSYTTEAHDHVVNMGTIVEDTETRMRSALNDIYFGKAKDIVNDLRSLDALSEKARQRAFQEEITKKLQSRGIVM